MRNPTKSKRERWRTALVLAFAVFCTGCALTGGEGSPDPPEKKTAQQTAASRENPVEKTALERETERSPSSPEAAAYLLMAGEVPEAEPEDIESVYHSKLDPSWAAVRVSVPGEDETYLIFLRREGVSWRAVKSIRADEPNYPEYEQVILSGVPEDLVSAIYPRNSSGEPRDTEPGPLPSVEPVEEQPPEPVTDGVPQDEADAVEEGLEEARQVIEEYDGVAGFYVRDPEGGYGYGIRPDGEFFAASVIKIPLMVAVYRRIEEGRLSEQSVLKTSAADWAGGAGQMQYELPGTPHTVEEYLEAMMTESDNVAANMLLRAVGGPGYVNDVAKSLGAKNTVMYQKISSERAVVPELDNRSTPRDVAIMLDRIQTGKAANPENCQEMISLMRGSVQEKWLEEPLPEDVEVANKSGWLYRVYDDAGIVLKEDRPYMITVLTKHGPEDVDKGKAVIEDLSRIVWEAQD